MSLIKRNSDMCCAVGCSMRRKTNLLSQVRLFKFPKDPTRRQLWESAVRRKNQNSNSKQLLCNLHFITGAPSADKNHPDYVPSVFYHRQHSTNARQKLARYERSVRRRGVENDSIVAGMSLLKTSNASCCAVGCSMRRKTNLLSQVRLFSFPKDPIRRQLWESAVGRKNWSSTSKSLLCNLHFVTGAPSMIKTHPDYVPTIFHHRQQSTNMGQKLSRYESSAKKRRVENDSIISDNGNVTFNDDSSLPELLAVLQGIPEGFRSNFDEGFGKCLDILNSKITALMHDPSSLRISSEQKGNEHVDFSLVKYRILVRMKELYEEVEKEWIDHLALIKADFMQNIERFVKKIEPEVKLPVVVKVFSYGDISNSPNTAHPELSSAQDIKPQGSTSQSLNYSVQQVPMPHSVEAISLSPLEAPSNKVVSHSTTNCTNATFSKPTPSINNQLVNNCLPNEPTQSPIPASSIYPELDSMPSTSDVTALTHALHSQTKAESPEKEYVCDKCEKKYNHKTDLMRHMACHTTQARSLLFANAAKRSILIKRQP